MSSGINASSGIQRTFGVIPQEEGADIEKMIRRDELGLASLMRWDELYESKRVLIIAESGAGKTFECQNQQSILWERGEAAFWIELSALATSSFAELLSYEEETRFREWQSAQSEIATFFLDSIDELKLTLKSFDLALKMLSKELHGRLDRVRIVITTRPISVERHFIRKHLPMPRDAEIPAPPGAVRFAQIASGLAARSAKEAASKDDLLIVNLRPLSDQQIREMAATQKVADIDAFLDSIYTKGAQEFARRPQDLIELCADWRASKTIRTHRYQVFHNIRTKLKPRTDRPEPAQLSPEKALEGASRLALAAMLTRRLTMRHSAESDLKSTSQQSTLDPTRLLPDWDAKEVQTLLERALFGFANYGRVRFHHRSVVEYLAGHRLETRLSAGMSIKAVKRMLFAETAQNVKVIKPSMNPAAAWLALSNGSIFEEVVARQPELLIMEGDPESLSPGQRIIVLRALIVRYGKGGRRGLTISELQANRFASRDLSPVIKDAWESRVENPEIRKLLLQLIGFADMANCSDFVHSLAMNPSAGDDERLVAIETLTRLTDPRLHELATSMDIAAPDWSEPLVRRAISLLFPLYMQPEKLGTLISALTVTEDCERDPLGELVQVIEDSPISVDVLGRLFNAVFPLVDERVIWSTTKERIFTSRPDLLHLLAITGVRLFNLKVASDEILENLALILTLTKGLRGAGSQFTTLREIFTKISPRQRERVFWRIDSLQQRIKSRSDPSRRMYATILSGVLTLSHAQDFEWVHEALTNPKRPADERSLMLEILLVGFREEIWDEWESYVRSFKRAGRQRSHWRVLGQA